MDYYDDDDGRRRWKWIAGAAVIVGLVGAFFILREDEKPSPSADFATLTSAAPSGSSAPTSSSDAQDGTSTSESAAAPSTTRDSAGTGSASTAPPTPSTAPPDAASTSTTNVAAQGPTSTPAPALDLGYPASPDGQPLPVVAIFDVDTITLTGQVPSQEAVDKLTVLAKANSKFPDAQIVDNLIVNPLEPISVGVRVIELTSSRFPSASAKILPQHATELDRVANVMNALPNVSVLVIGHADQAGSELGNFAISDERARAVVNYLIYVGISPSRLSSRAEGETELLTVNDDETSLALNRRTEFIFYGLLTS